MYCPNCGKENADDAHFCSACGSPLDHVRSGDATPTPAPFPAPPPVNARFPAATRPPAPKKNYPALILGVIGAVSAFLGALIWASCTDIVANCGETGTHNAPSSPIFLVLFVVLGIGGSVIATIGSIQAFNYARGRFVLSLIGFLAEAGCLASEIVMLALMSAHMSFVLTGFTMVALILLFVELCYSLAKDPNKKTGAGTP